MKVVFKGRSSNSNPANETNQNQRFCEEVEKIQLLKRWIHGRNIKSKMGQRGELIRGQSSCTGPKNRALAPVSSDTGIRMIKIKCSELTLLRLGHS